MNDTATADRPREKVTRRDLAEGHVEKVITERSALVPLTHEGGGLVVDDMLKCFEIAKAMATCGPMLPPWLQGNVGGCLGIIIRASELGISALTLANASYVVNNRGVERVAYESSLYQTIMNKYADRFLTSRLQYKFEGEGDARRCFVFATFKGESEPRQWPPAGSGDEWTLGKLRPARNQSGQVKGSPLWETKPDQQLLYSMIRDWSRAYAQDIVAGIYAKEEFPDAEDVTNRPYAARDVSPRLAERLRGQSGDGFKGSIEIDAALDAARETQSDSASAPVGGVPDAAAKSPDNGGPGSGADTSIAPNARSAPTISDAAPSPVTTPEPQGTAASGETAPGVAAEQPDADAMRDVIATARQRGRDDRNLGKSKKAVPTEYRDNTRTAEALAWREGWDSVGGET